MNIPDNPIKRKKSGLHRLAVHVRAWVRTIRKSITVRALEFEDWWLAANQQPLTPALLLGTASILIAIICALDLAGFRGMVVSMLYVAPIWIVGSHPKLVWVARVTTIAVILTILGTFFGNVSTAHPLTIFINRALTILMLCAVAILVTLRARGRSRESRFLETIRLTPNPLAILDAQHQVVWQNSRYEQFSSTTSAQGQHDHDREDELEVPVHPRAHFIEHLRKCVVEPLKLHELQYLFAQGRPFVISELAVQLPSKTSNTSTLHPLIQERTFTLHATPLREGIELKGYAVALIDITSIQREKQFTAQQLRYNQSVLNALRKPVCVVRDDQSIVYINRAFEILEERSSLTRQELVHLLSQYGERQNGNGTGSAAVPSNNFFEVPFVREESEQSCATFLVNHSLLAPDLSGERQTLYTLQDVTELKATMEKLENSNQDLRQFAYVASHDLQEPLRKIASYLQILEEDHAPNLNEEARECIAFAVDGANRLRNLIRDLLTYARVANPRDQRHAIDLTATVELVKADLDALLEETKGTITINRLPIVQGNPTAIEMLLRNLFSNACKYRSPDRQLDVHIGASLMDRHWCIWIRDNGIGIETAFQERIFGIFQRLHSQTEIPGTGLGLALCRKIVAQHGGKLWVESTPGEGSTFYFTIAKSEGVRKNSESTGTASKRGQRPPKKSSHMLSTGQMPPSKPSTETEEGVRFLAHGPDPS